ncbi:MAG: hypothetical protein WD558_02515, partial [Pseudomonadales bacterium]
MAVLVATLLLSSPASAIRASGYLKSYAIARDRLEVPQIDADELYQSQNSVRLMWDYLGDQIAFQFHYELGAVLSSKEPFLPQPTSTSDNRWRLVDIDSTPNDNPQAQLLQNLDRFNLQFNFESGDLTIGRQAITFGMARIINPTDVFLPFDVKTLNTEYRVGIDAIRFQRPLGQLGELDLGIIPGKDAGPDTSAAFLRLRNNSSGVDYQLTLARFVGESLAGVGIETSLGNFGFWLEV